MEKVIVITVDGLSQENLDTVQKQLDLVRTHLADLPDQLLARGIHGVKFTWQPKENIAQILTVSMTGKYLTNGIRLARPFITNLTAIEKWHGPKTITINIENKEITFVGASHE